MTSKRLRTDDLETIKKLTEALGKKLWEHALVVLTSANEVAKKKRKTDDVPEATAFNDRVLAFKKAINKHLVAIGVPEITAANVPFTPAGELDDPRLPDREDWLTAFWIAAFKRINRNAKAAFLMASIDRISFSSSEGKEESKIRKDGKVGNLGQLRKLSIEENNAITEFRAKLKESDFYKELNRCVEKTKMSDEPEEECPTSPGQDVKVSGPSIKVGETYSEDLIEDMFGDVTELLLGELTGAKFGRKYQTFFGWVMKYFKNKQGPLESLYPLCLLVPVSYQTSSFYKTGHYFSPGGLGGREDFGCCSFFLSAFFRNVCCYPLHFDNSYNNCGRYEKTKNINCSNVLKLLRQDGMENYFSLQTLMIKSSFSIHPHNDHGTLSCLQNLLENCLLRSQKLKLVFYNLIENLRALSKRADVPRILASRLFRRFQRQIKIFDCILLLNVVNTLDGNTLLSRMAQEGTPEKRSGSSASEVSQIIFGEKHLEYQLNQFVSSGGQTVNILLSGKTGVGKSYLTNALLGESLAVEGYDIDPQTDNVTAFEVVKNGVSITVFDTPGLADATGNDEEYLRKINEKVNHFDLFLFCTEMTSRRFRTDDLETIKKLTEALGEKLWQHALVVLTFANEVSLLPAKKKDNVPEVTFFNNRFLAFKKAIKKHLVAIGVPEITVTNLPFTPAGELDDPRLPDREDWLTAFWIAAFKRINRNAKAAFLMANVDRISLSSTFGEGNEESRVRKDGNVVNLGQSSNVSMEESNAMKEFRAKLKKSDFDKRLSGCLEKTEFDEPEEECLTSPGQDAKVSGPSINVDETHSEELIKEMLGDVPGQFVDELAGDKFDRKYQTFFGRLTKYLKKSYPTS
ncbi:unnamed protein product [Pocillopora meandrina]|uniref:AIG1-type G domain-containing protein n=1 Tax=Pocillopora meandrina TaxID=46732 RepID=A0AAU9WZM0_9CNID|nr:unnamed protein product [Pocillopora meandrina]